MARTASDFLVERLHAWGVRRIFGYPGDGINGVIGALGRATDKIEFVQVRHEETAALMACAHAKFTGQAGVCLATSGPGAIHLLNGLYDARMDHQPVLALLGQQATFSLGADFQQEVDLVSLFKDVAHHYVQLAASPAQVRHLIDRAMRIAIAERTVTCLVLPNDVQEMDAVDPPPRRHGVSYTGIGYSAPYIVPTDEDLHAAARILNQGDRVAILVGAGATGAASEVMEVAELLGAGVAKALLGKAVLADDLPYVTGAIGLLGTKPSWDMMMECDTLLMVGSGFPYAEFLPKLGQARGVQIDISPRQLSLRYPMDVNLHGQSGHTLQLLIPLLKRKQDRSWRERIEERVREWWLVLEARAMNEAEPINPQRVFWELSPRLPDRAVLTCDSGTVADWYARDVRIRPGMLASLSGNLASMGSGVPYAIAAKFAYPDRPVIAMVGDGAMQMNGLNELITIEKYWKRWRDPRLVVLVLNNQDLNLVTWEQRVFAGDPKFAASQELPDFPYARYAALLGFGGVEMATPDDVGRGWDRALAEKRPVVVEAHTDPEVPPLPPHITFDQAKSLAKAMLKGDEDTWDILRRSASEVIDGLLPHRR
jgi:pyruvate dehydrogenase (quinone)